MNEPSTPGTKTPERNIPLIPTVTEVGEALKTSRI